MKGVIKKSLVLVVLAVTIATNASNVLSASKEVTNITFENVKKGSTLTIKDSYGLVLYKEQITESGDYTKAFDLTALPNGNYYFEMDNDIIIELIPFEVSNTVVLFKKEAKQIINKPFIIKRGEQLIISKLSMGFEPLEVAIYFENGDLVFKDEIKGEQVIEKAYNFSTSENGNYSVILKSEGKSFKKYVKF